MFRKFFSKVVDYTPAAVVTVGTVGLFATLGDGDKKRYDEFKRKYPNEEPVAVMNHPHSYCCFFTYERKKDNVVDSLVSLSPSLSRNRE